jgi:hypothetical protein
LAPSSRALSAAFWRRGEDEVWMPMRKLPV